MKNLKFFTLAIAILGFTATSFAQSNTSQVTSNAGATIISPISLTKGDAELHFGKIVGVLGTVTVDPANVRTSSNAASFTFGMDDHTVAKFNVSGNLNSTYAITVPTGDVEIAETGGQKMIVNAFTPSKTTGTLATGTGTDTFTVGATLNVTAGQAVGEYTGTYLVTVAYN